MRCIKCGLLNFFFCFMPLNAIGAPVLFYLGFSAHGPFPSLSKIVIQCVFFMIVEDFCGYWIHRWMHTPWAFKHIHYVHHKYNTPFPLANLYMHPGEMLDMGIAVVIGPLMIGPHLFTHWLWISYRMIDSFAQHSGYEFPWDPRKALFFMENPRLHDSHHIYVRANFGFNYLWWDRLFGTYRSVDKAVLRQYLQSKKPQPLSE